MQFDTVSFTTRVSISDDDVTTKRQKREGPDAKTRVKQMARLKHSMCLLFGFLYEENRSRREVEEKRRETKTTHRVINRWTCIPHSLDTHYESSLLFHLFHPFHHLISFTDS